MKNRITFRTVLSTMLVLGSLSLAVSASATPPRHFHFYYLGNHDDRHDVNRLQGGLWEEVFPNGDTRKFHTVNTAYHLYGNQGTLVKADDSDYYLFFPDRDATGTNPDWIMQALAGHTFTYFVEMEGIE